MPLSSGHGIAGAILKGGAHVSKRFEGAAAGMNAVHGIALQGHIDAHLQQKEHENHLKTIEEAHRMAGGKGFEVRTGSHSLRVNGDRGGKKKPEGGKPESRNEETQGHYESAKEQSHQVRDEAAAPVESAKPKTMMKSSDGKRELPAPGQRPWQDRRRPRKIQTDSTFRGIRAAKPAADDVEGNIKAATAPGQKKLDFAANRLQPTIKNYKKDN